MRVFLPAHVYVRRGMVSTDAVRDPNVTAGCHTQNHVNMGTRDTYIYDTVAPALHVYVRTYGSSAQGAGGRTRFTCDTIC